MIDSMSKPMSRAETYARWWRRIISEYELLLARVDQQMASETTDEELAALRDSRASIIENLEEARRELSRLLDKPTG